MNNGKLQKHSDCSAFLACSLIAAFLVSCGEVSGGTGGGEPRPPKSSSSNFSSSSESSSSSVFSINLNWKKTPPTSYIHGTTENTVITLDAFLISDLITQKQYETVMEVNPSAMKSESSPIDGVSWDKAAEFCEKLSALLGYAIRLPTEVEWEYASYGGVFSPSQDYWEWTNDCFDSIYPWQMDNPSGPPNCLSSVDKVRKGLGYDLARRVATPPNSTYIGVPGDLSFRVVTRNEDLLENH